MLRAAPTLRQSLGAIGQSRWGPRGLDGDADDGPPVVAYSVPQRNREPRRPASLRGVLRQVHSQRVVLPKDLGDAW